MLENGADIRIIQEMLGHAKLTTTELSTRVSIHLPKQVYTATHPGANPHARNVPRACDTAAEAELLGALATEEAEESE